MNVAGFTYVFSHILVWMQILMEEGKVQFAD